MPAASYPKLPPSERIGRLTTDQYFRMIQSGIIKEGAPYELLDGLLVLKDRSKKGDPLMSIGDDHTLVVGLLAVAGAKLFGRGCFMQVQCPITLSSFQAPEPDGAIVRGALRDYTKRSRLGSDVSSVIEVADSSLKSDREDKSAIYAGAGIPQFVIVNLVDRVIENYEQPDIDAKMYLNSQCAKVGESVEFLLPDATRLSVAVEDLLP